MSAKLLNDMVILCHDMKAVGDWKKVRSNHMMMARLAELRAKIISMSIEDEESSPDRERLYGLLNSVTYVLHVPTDPEPCPQPWTTREYSGPQAWSTI